MTHIHERVGLSTAVFVYTSCDALYVPRHSLRRVSSSDRDNSVDALVVLASTDCREIPILEVRAPSGKSVFEAPAFSWRSLIVLDLKPITEEVESGVGPIVGLEILPWINRTLDLRTRLSLAILKTR